MLLADMLDQLLDIEDANDETTVKLLIETIEGWENVDISNIKYNAATNELLIKEDA